MSARALGRPLLDSPKNPVLVAAGKRGAARRWGEARIVRLDTLDPTVQRAIRALVDADRAARQRDPDPGPEAA